MIRRPPRSTLFAYTTSSDLAGGRQPGAVRALRRRGPPPRRRHADRPARSEEHTSELQSRRDLVCRLLLEKKKKTSDVMHERCAEIGVTEEKDRSCETH